MVEFTSWWGETGYWLHFVESFKIFNCAEIRKFLIVQKKVNTAELRSLERLIYSLWLVSGNLDLGRVPTIPRIDKEWLTLLYLFVHTMWFMLNTCISSGSLEFWYVLGRCCLNGQSQDVELSLINISCALSQLFIGRIKHALCDFCERWPLETYALFSLDFATCTFSLCWLCLVSSL